MNNILLIHNKSVFDKEGFVTLPMKNDVDCIPNYSCILFLGSHDRGTDHIDDDLQYTLFSISHKPYQYVILIGKTDDTINHSLSIPDNVIRIYANNIDYKHDKIRFFPMGRDFRSIEHFKSSVSYNERSILCYCNYSINTHPVREKIYNNIKSKPFIMFEHMGNFLDYHIPREHFFKQLSNSKFTICPRGNACDTFRFYDSIYSGCIPIVVSMPYHEHFKELPVVFLENENEYDSITEEQLSLWYSQLSPKLSNYYPELDLDFWLNIIKSDLLIHSVV